MLGQDPYCQSRTQPLTEPAAGATPFGTSESGSGFVGVGARIAGIDPPSGRALTPEERSGLLDPFFTHLLGQGKLPATVAELLAMLDAVPEAPSEQMVFVVSEAGQIPHDAPGADFPRLVRYAVTRSQPGAGPEILISTRAASTDPEAFLQVAGWDSTNAVFHFFERVGAAWFWEGSSWHAFDPRSQGNGPFDSHVSGTLVMKELRLPWLHWNSSAQQIPLESFPPDHPVRTDPLFEARQSADLLETRVVRPAVRRWTRARLDRVLSAPGGVAEPQRLLRHLLTASSVNIAASEERSRGNQPSFRLPPTFFLDVETIVNQFGVEVEDLGAAFHVARSDYEAALAALGVELRNGSFRQQGDAFFAWPVPERAFEDCVVSGELVRRGVLSLPLALGLVMLDFCNPIDSPLREKLLDLVPPGPTAADQIDSAIRAAVSAADPSGAVAGYLALDDQAARGKAAAAIDAYLARVTANLAAGPGVADYMRLADARRRAFRRRRLAEFDLSLPYSTFGDSGQLLRMTESATVVPK